MAVNCFPCDAYGPLSPEEVKSSEISKGGDTARFRFWNGEIRARHSRDDIEGLKGGSVMGKRWVVVGLIAAIGVAVSMSPVLAQGKAASKPITVTGRVVDAVCMLPGGLKGESHRECAIGCDKAGVRMYLLDEKANVMYSVMADAPFKNPNAPLREHLERIVTVKGDVYTGPGGHRVVAVKEVQAAKAGAANPCAAKPAAANPCAGKNPCAPKK